MNWFDTALHAPDIGNSSGAASPSGGPGAPSPGAAGGNGLDSGHGLSQGARPGDGQAGPGAVGDPSRLAAPSFAMPDFIPQHLRDDDVGKFAVKLADDWKRQRDDIARRATPVPKDAAGYAFNPSEKAKGYVGNLTQDPVFLAFREQAHKAGMSPSGFQDLLSGFYDTLVDKGVLGQPYDAARERRGYLGDESKTMSDEQTIEAMRPHIASAETFLNGLGRNGTLRPEAVKALEPLLETAVGLRTLGALRHAMGSRGLSLGGDSPGETGLTRTDLQARMRDPRNDRSSGKYDPKFAAQIDADYKRLFGGPS
jgi:hypothetical protein